ncbi:Invasion-inducing protein TIAM1/CDC24 and related RhoGEF GTPases [Ceraceosorus bombacis]|uniref:Invasion-inducing protein TIAM1/CDC24 and related RhoGEF GTPases n=1 Tax=Ceraceosorus bombacis TaxID=401625 RepID=A0A0P1B9J8_9BASI|nr:Invasion-inducing protein TIAM1/CDC24 and related RhoGEF GTPases [Ceraceosorus bombacis]
MVAQLQGAKGTMAASASAPLAESEDVQDDRIGQFFLKMMPRIESIYSAYCSRHEASISRLQELTLSSSKASVFLKECTEAARVHTNAWDLASLLIKPVQRVLKYPLLIQQILTSTPASHPDEPNLRAALMEIQQVADNINEVKKRKDLVENILTGKSAPNMQRTASSTKRPKRKSDKAKHVLAGPSIEPITDDYVRLSAQLHTLRRNVHRFTRHCLDWSRAQKNAYESEIALTFQIGSVYRLGLDAAAIQEEAGAETPDTRQSAACEMLRGLVNGPWRQMDNDIRSTILPMTQRIEQMFENPIAVLAKRDERESDYQRYRAALAKSDKVPDKKLVDSANAFVALHAQLLDELPQFIYGVQTLLDIGVQAFARLQGTHHLQAKRARLAYWSEHAYASNELAIHPGTRELTLRHVQTVRVFWHAHEEAASFAETLVIANRDQVSLQEPAQPQDRFIIAAQADDSRQVISYDPQLATSSRPSGPALLAPPGTSGRRPSGVAGLMRSLSGNFSREHSPTGEKVPPLPSGASALAAASRTAENHARVADQPPALSLTFKSGSSSRDSWFVLSGDANSLPFLSPPAEGGPQLEPYDLSPAQTTKPLPDEPKAADMPRSVEESRARPLPQNRHKMRVIALLTAQAESPLRDPAGRLGWPWLAFAPGDNIAVLSFDKSDEAVLAFGRGADGTLGWAERDLFVETRDSSSTTHDVEG